jgi:two-component system phosphate regulon sensor histidine kinase PhoR
LGLAIVKHVLLRHNAELRIVSRLGKGSEFSCHFPQSMVVRLPPEQTQDSATSKS